MGASHRSRLVLCLATVYVVWGSSYLASRIGVMHLPPLLFGGIRFVVASLLLGAFALWRGFDFTLLRREWRHVVVLGLVGIAFVNGTQVWALQWVPSHSGALLNASCAFWIVAFGLFGRRGHRPSALALTGIIIGFLGTALLIWPEPAHGSVPATPLGPQLVILVACVAWAGATIYMRNIDTRMDVFALTALQMLFGGVVLCGLGLALGEAARFELSRPGLLAMVWQTIFSSCFAYTAYAWLAQNASPAQTGTYGYVNPVIASILGYLVLDERMTGLQLAASAVVVAGVLLVNWPSSVTMRAPPRAT